MRKTLPGLPAVRAGRADSLRLLPLAALLGVALSACASTRSVVAPRPAPAAAKPPATPAAREAALMRADALLAQALIDGDAARAQRRLLVDAVGAAEAAFAWAWRLARAEFLCSRRAGTHAGQAADAERAVAWARQALRREPQRVEGHYYLALGLGQLAEARSKLSLVKPMEAAGKRAAELDPRFDGAGPLVFLGKLYLSAPGWPLSIGDVERAVATLRRALALEPRPLTRLFLAQALAANDERAEAARELQAVLALQTTLEPRWQAEAARLRQKLGLAVAPPTR
ncbi:MAG: hypothetical protein IPL40_12955 [Proteobacteria bacterium]|nr:hypothetical protein [Pseudomonadota bacterium]